MLKKLYRKYFSRYERKETKMHLRKTRLFEWIAIFKKRKLYKHIKYDKIQKSKINDIWKETTVKKVSHRWHKLYQSINGTFNEYYVPDYIFSTLIEPKTSPIRKANFYDDKSMLDIIYSNVEGLRLPETFLLNIDGTLYDRNRDVITFNDAIEILSVKNSFVIKPTVGTSSGESVKVFTETQNNKDLQNLLNKYGTNYIVQERINQQETFRKLHPNSVNTLRVITYNYNNIVEVAPITMRIGNSNNTLDNSHAGGLAIKVNDLGCLGKYAYKLGWTDCKEMYESHPYTNIIFENYQLNNIDKIKRVAVELHKKTPYMKFISWDLVLDDKDNVVLIEGNYRGQAIWLSQITHGEGIFLKNTSSVINYLINERGFINGKD